ncbi:sterol desaturase family protein [Sphingobacterium yanglingense]|uniref:Beta-carotene 3-hydroxylase n=1 Tax=Sphingobacterium yanglingense TaxID=1437280 RepID=A0A4R6WDZ0_9SPHI|nr:sterol desaturase family protein [Sphingobacterium yanglingense]TDQ77953.1 beta-carotene 3-hydroxylase [Sphingobacterium yanglingense]
MMYIAIVIGVFILMEGFTWCVHKYVMHGFLWCWHKDHHNPEHDKKLERNDYFFVVFAIPAIWLLYIGSRTELGLLFFIGLGIAIYGMAYFFVHDIFIHQRLKIFKHTDSPYLKAIRRAHKQHHKHRTKEQGECFGFLWVPLYYFKMYFKK